MRKGSMNRLKVGPIALALFFSLPWCVPSMAQDATPPPAPVQEYRIGVNDLLTVFNYQEGKSEDCLVRPDGKITLNLAGDVKAAGLTPTELSAVIVKAIEAWYKQPIVNVAVREIHSYRVFVLGRVGTQSMLESPSPLRLLQALAMAGGLTDFASKEILVIREGPKGQERIKAEYEKILSGKAPEMNLELKSGDTVVAL